MYSGTADSSENQEISLQSLRNYLMMAYSDRPAIVHEGNLHLLVDRLRGYGYVTITQLHRTLLRVKPAFEAYERAHPLNEMPISRLVPVGIVWISMSLLHEGFSQREPTAIVKCRREELEGYRSRILPPETQDAQSGTRA